MSSNWKTALDSLGIVASPQWCAYDGSRRIDSALRRLEADAQAPLSVSFAGADWNVAARLDPAPASDHGAAEGFDLALRFTCKSGKASQISVGLHLEFSNWSMDNYILMPAAMYAGNRFKKWPTNKVSQLMSGYDPQAPVSVSGWVPVLSCDPQGPSGVQFLTGDLSTPAVVLQMPDRRRGFIVMTDQGTRLGNTGISLIESEDRTTAQLLLKAPGVREIVRCNGKTSTDRGADFAAGDELELRARLYFFDAPTIPAAVERFFQVREDLAIERHRQMIPFSAVWAIQQDKYNRQNWVESDGYYSVGMREVPSQDWQTAWVGGFNASHALIAAGDELTRRRALRTFDHVFDDGILPSGFYNALYHKGEWLGKATLLRYMGDSLHFNLKSLMLLERRGQGDSIPDRWKKAIRGVADAFVRIWKKYGEFGHYADQEGNLIVAGTASASLAPGGLALASVYFNHPEYLEVAKASGRHYRDRFLSIGYTNAGPGDALQCPDSESNFALLDAYLSLYDVTGEAEWIDAARDTANLGSTWCVTYDYRFPASSTFGKLDMLTTGTVYANVQNKHSAPGLCTLSGDSLLKLFRATGDRRYLALIQRIAHAIPQYCSRADRPITDRRPGQRWPIMDPGWINERVNMSDWEVRGDPDNEIGVGEIFGGSTWSEAAMLLTFAELPGVYIQPDVDLVCCLDHVDAVIIERRQRELVVEITNPTTFDAPAVKIFAETAEAALVPLGANAFVDLFSVPVAAGATVRATVPLIT